MPRSFTRAMNAGGYSPMIDETTRGAASRTASHCALKSGSATSPASGGTAGPHEARNARRRASASASRRGGGSGIQLLICSGPFDCALKAPTHSAMPDGGVTSAPSAPMPPALATATDRLTGHAPAIGASRIGQLEAVPERRRPSRDRVDERHFFFAAPAASSWRRCASTPASSLRPASPHRRRRA